MTEIQLSIRGEDLTELREQFGLDRSNTAEKLEMDDASLTYISEDRTLGVGASLDVVNLALSLGVGVSTGIVSNWVYALCTSKKDEGIHVIIGEDVANDVSELEILIKKKSARKHKKK